MSNQLYYQLAQEGSSHIGDHPGLLKIHHLAETADKILDFGCGEGTRLITLLPSNKTGYGVDINDYAINSAQQKYPHHHFTLLNSEEIPFKNNFFDLVYSAFVLEHTQNPEKNIQEMIRVLRPGGNLILICPNFGAPNRRSPNSTESPLKKLVSGFIQDITNKPNSLNWTKVTPKPTFKNIDDDTTIEPYIHSLMIYLEKQGLDLIKASSLWELEPKTLNPRKLITRFLGKLNLYPFKFWGPQIFIQVYKPKP